MSRDRHDAAPEGTAPSCGGATPARGPRRFFVNLLKVLIFLASAAILVRMIDWPEFWRSLMQVPPAVFIMVVFLNLAAAVVMALRWHLLILAAGHRLAFREVTAYTMLGMFYNQILPGSVSGDAARIWCLGGRHTGWKKSAGIVLWDRVLGLAALIFILMGTIPAFYDRIMPPRLAAAIWVGLLLGLLLIGGLQSKRFLRAAERFAVGLALRLRGEKSIVYVEALFSGVRTFLSDRMTTLKAFALSLLVRAIWLVGAWALSSSMDLPVPVLYFFFAVPLVELIRMVPFSIQGLGIRELALIFLLAPFGVSAAKAALLSMLFFTGLTVAGLLGGLLYAGRKLWGVKV